MMQRDPHVQPALLGRHKFVSTQIDTDVPVNYYEFMEKNFLKASREFIVDHYHVARRVKSSRICFTLLNYLLYYIQYVSSGIGLPSDDT
ncbi:hypothetical protein HW555_003979 [Spodoptera exigua]|uniref:Uncharacterized protein n=1 Tax=Spodoptera exigua TaxID=7107 RepID=A0A835GMK3_SPOEX|nr:hypothetical protein HW555_003979 [Spodoptera exigua]